MVELLIPTGIQLSPTATIKATVAAGTTTTSVPDPTSFIVAPDVPNTSSPVISEFKPHWTCPSTCNAATDPLRLSGVLLTCSDTVTVAGSPGSTIWNIPGDCSLTLGPGTSCTADCTTSTKDKTGIKFTTGQVTGPVPKTCSVITDGVNSWPVIACGSKTISQGGASCTVVPKDGNYAGVYVTVACPPLYEYRALSGSPLPIATKLVIAPQDDGGATSWTSTYVTQDPIIISRSLALLSSPIAPPPANPAPTTSMPTATAINGSGTGESAKGNSVSPNLTAIVGGSATSVAILILAALFWRLKGREWCRHKLYTSKRGQDIKLAQNSTFIKRTLPTVLVPIGVLLLFCLLIWVPGRKWYIKRYDPIWARSSTRKPAHQRREKGNEAAAVGPSIELAEYSVERLPIGGERDFVRPSLKVQEYDR